MKRFLIPLLIFTLVLPTTIISVNGSFSTLKYNLLIDGTQFEIPWHMKTGKVSHIEVDKEQNSLTVSLARFQIKEDNLLIKLPTKLVTDEDGSGFAITVDDKKVDYKEIWKSDQVIQLEIPLSNDATKIQIFATHSAPEFPTALLTFGTEAFLIVLVLGMRGKSSRLIRCQ